MNYHNVQNNGVYNNEYPNSNLQETSSHTNWNYSLNNTPSLSQQTEPMEMDNENDNKNTFYSESSFHSQNNISNSNQFQYYQNVNYQEQYHPEYNNINTNNALYLSNSQNTFHNIEGLDSDDSQNHLEIIIQIILRFFDQNSFESIIPNLVVAKSIYNLFIKLYKVEGVVNMYPKLLYNLLFIALYVGYEKNLPTFSFSVQNNISSFRNVIDKTLEIVDRYFDQLNDKITSDTQMKDDLELNSQEMNSYTLSEILPSENPLEKDVLLLETIDLEDRSIIKSTSYKMNQEYELVANCYYYAGRVLPSLRNVIPENVNSIQFFEISASFGKLEALERLGWFYSNQKQYEKAIIYYRKAMIHHHEASMINLGHLYESKSIKALGNLNPDMNENILDQHPKLKQYSSYFPTLNLKMALHYYYMAALSGSPVGWFNMGTMFKNIQLFKESLSCYIKAISMEYSTAYVALGRAYYRGRGVNLSYENAFLCFLQGARRRDMDAIINLGSMYKLGRGVQQSLSKALELYEYASQNGEEVMEEIQELRKRIIDSCTCIGKI